MFPKIELRGVSFTAWDTGKKLLDQINLTVFPGERIGIVGPSGSGKTTLSFHLAGIHQTALTGRTEGEILINDKPFHKRRESSGEICEGFRAGMVLQNPESQLFSTHVKEEVGYGLGAQTNDRVHEVLRQVGLEGFENREISALSLGQKQRVVIAAFLALSPHLLILDEPTNSLDAKTTRQLLRVLGGLRMTQVMIEHDLETLCQWADRIVEMRDGKIVSLGTPEDWLENAETKPRFFRLADAIGRRYSSPPPFERPSGLLGWAENVESTGCYHINGMQKNQCTEKEVLRFEEVSCGYKGREQILSGVSFTVKAGERVVLLGLNGSGKTTLLKHIAGLKKPLTGKIKLNGIDIATKTPDTLFGDVGLVFQNPDYQIFDTTVERECGFCLRNQKYEAGEMGRRVHKWLALFGISGMKDRSPLTLSFGEKRRLTLASVLVAEPELVLLDEPTTALDEANIAALRQTLLDLSLHHGKTLCITTHDLDFALDVATRILIIGDGKLMADISIADITFELLEQCGIPAPFPSRLAQKTGISKRPAGHWHILKSITNEITGNH